MDIDGPLPALYGPPEEEPFGPPAPAPTPADLDERLRRMESTLAQLQELEKRLAAREAIQEHPSPPKVESPSLMSRAASMLSPGTPKPGSMSDAVAELRAVYRMFVDPRYSMTWLCRFGVPGLLVLFFLPSLWVPLTAVLPAWIAGLVGCVGQLAAGYILFKIVFQEARRYRETAPDLPPSLRL